jgi:hypothetical protein
MAATLLVLGLLLAPDAGARDMNGRLGLGGARTLAGVQGIDVTYWAGRLGLVGTLNIFMGFPEEDAPDPDAFFKPAVALGAIFPFIANDRAELSIGGRVNLAIAHGETQISLEAPLRIEWYVTDHLSLHGEVGLVIEIVPEEDRLLTAAGGTDGMNGTGIILGGTNLSAGAGFSFFF